jgi:monoamine oxidase
VEDDSILILGGGAAGLSAAWHLAQHGVSATLLEARHRLGGRICTVWDKNAPIELGAEFIHGAKTETWSFIEQGDLKVQSVTGRHWEPIEGALVENTDFEDRLARVVGKIDPKRPDTNFETFLHRHSDIGTEEAADAREYIEGFHAAPAEKISAHAVRLAQEAAENEKGQEQFRFDSGHEQLISWFEKELSKAGTRIRFETAAKTIRWREGRVEVLGEGVDGGSTYTGRAVIIALPLGVLQKRAVTFDPALKAQQDAIDAIGNGSVVKVILRFRSRLWPLEDFGFLHTHDDSFPTWWTNGSIPIITAWAGGSRAERLAKSSDAEIFDEALCAMKRIFKLEKMAVRSEFDRAWVHNWSSDPFAFGAYSYLAAGCAHASETLQRPVKNTLFFAGEAFSASGDHGTVHGALESGKRAALALLESQNLGTLRNAEVKVS